MTQLAVVALGGAAGACARFLTVSAMAGWLGRGFPWGTLTVNVGGSMAIGILWVFLQRSGTVDPWYQLLIVGFLGAFTTFSAFSLELLIMLEAERWMQAVSYALGSVVTCLVGVAIGVTLARLVSQ